MVNHYILSRLYNSVSTDVLHIVHHPDATTFSVRRAIDDLFHIHHAVYLEAQFCNLDQGDMTNNEYYGHLKLLVDTLRNIG